MVDRSGTIGGGLICSWLGSGGGGVNIFQRERHALGTVKSFVDADEAIGQFEHVVTQADDDELRVARSFLRRK